MSIVVPISKVILPKIEPQSYSRNGQVAPGIAMSALARGLNQVARWRGKEVFVGGGRLGGITASAGVGPTVVWRSYLHTGPYCDSLRWSMTLARPDVIDLPDSRATIELQDSSGTTIETDTAYWGPTDGAPKDIVGEFGTFSGTLPVSTDTDYRLVFSVEDNGRLSSAVVYEQSLKPIDTNGYVVDTYSSVTPILDDARSTIAAKLYALWRRGAAVCMHWHGSRTNATATDTNIVDGTSTAVAASSPGYTLFMSGTSRLKDSGPNAVVYVWGSVASGSGGSVKVKNAAGSTIATVTGFTTTPSWRSAAVVLTTTYAKYDITLATAVGALTITEVVIYQYDT